ILEDLAQNAQTPAPIPAMPGQKLPPVASSPSRPAPPLPGLDPTPAPKPAPSPSRRSRPLLIALDPGHGGEDPGAIGPRGTREKDIVLQIAKRLQKLIDAQPNMRAYMTRD